MVIGHVILCASSGLALSLYTSHAFSWQFGTFVSLFGHSIIGIINSMNEGTENSSYLFSVSLSIVDIIPLPFINTELYLNNRMGADLAQLHAISGLVPIVTSFCCEDRFTENLKDIIIIGNVISCAILSVKKDEPLYAILAAIAAVNRFVIGSVGSAEGLSIGLSAFSFCAAHILKNRELSQYLK